MVKVKMVKNKTEHWQSSFPFHVSLRLQRTLHSPGGWVMKHHSQTVLIFSTISCCEAGTNLGE